MPTEIAMSKAAATVQQTVIADWNGSAVRNESTLHQLSPYIGKLKSSIARSLVSQFTDQGDLIYDPFSGSGTIALEAWASNRGYPDSCTPTTPRASGDPPSGSLAHTFRRAGVRTISHLVKPLLTSQKSPNLFRLLSLHALYVHIGIPKNILFAHYSPLHGHICLQLHDRDRPESARGKTAHLTTKVTIVVTR